MEVASNATADVGLELFRHLSDGRITERTENIFISAYGILSALSMLLLGVKDRSEEELLTLMKIKQDGLIAYHERWGGAEKEFGRVGGKKGRW